MINAQRLLIARNRRKMSVSMLSSGSGVPIRALRDIEAGGAADEIVTRALAEALEFPVEFFSGDDIDLATGSQVSFRGLKSMTKKVREAMEAAGGMAQLVNTWASSAFSLPSCNVPDLSGMEPEEAAQAVREEWGLGLMSIRNMIHVLEANGVRVFSITEESRDVDAFSFYRDGIPFVLMNTQKSAARGRHDAAHELGHLVLHRNSDSVSDAAEHEADRFASAFLMPSTTMIGIRSGFHVRDLVKLKSRWNVSVASLNYRLHSIGAIDAIQYRDNCIEISRLGWRSSEPEDRPREKSLIWEKILSKMRDKSMSIEDVCMATGLSSHDIRSFAFGMVIMSAEDVSGDMRSLIRPQRGEGFVRLATVSGKATPSSFASQTK